MAQINFPVATADGQTFEAPNGVIYTYVGTPPNGYWSGTFQDQSLQTLDGRYLKLDASNDPLTSSLTIASGDSRLNLIDTDTGATGQLNGNSAGGNLGINVDIDSVYSADNESSLIVFNRGTENFRVRGDGKVTVGGNPNPAAMFDVKGDIMVGAAGIEGGQITLRGVDGSKTVSFWDVYRDDQIRFFTNQDDVKFSIGSYSSGGEIALRTNNQERLYVTSDGNVGIGTTDPQADLDVVGSIITGPNSAAGPISTPNQLGTDRSADIQVNSQGDNNPSISLNHARGNSLGSSCFMFNKAYGSFTTPTVLGNNATIGSLVFNGFDGTNYVRAAQIQVDIDGTPGTNSMPARLMFNTTADGASSPTERMRIDSRGFVGIGTDTPISLLNVQGGGLNNGANAYSSKVCATLEVNRAGGTDNDFNDDTGYGAILEFRHDSNRYVSIESRSEQKQSGKIGLTFKTMDGANSTNESMRLTNDGNLLLTQANAGIFLNGETASANKLDDYEEGSFTPQFRATTTNPTYTAGSAQGFYTKVGRQVHFTITLSLTSLTNTPSGTLTIAGLPFTSLGQKNARAAGAVGYSTAFDDTVGAPVGWLMGSNATQLTLYRRSGDLTYINDVTGLPATSLTNNSTVRFSGSYTAA